MTGAGSESSRAPLRVAPDQVRGDGGLTIGAAHRTRYSAWMAKLYFYYASMNAGKSTTLLQADFNYRERGMETMLWTAALDDRYGAGQVRSEEHTSELQSLMRISYAVFCLKKKKK